METFKKPFSSEEEKEYLLRCREGDMEARNQLIEHNLRLVAHVAKKYQSAELDSDDLVSIGIIGLIKAVMTFDPEKNSRLGTYAARCIEKPIRSPTRFRVRKKQSEKMVWFNLSQTKIFDAQSRAGNFAAKAAPGSRRRVGVEKVDSYSIGRKQYTEGSRRGQVGIKMGQEKRGLPDQ